MDFSDFLVLTGLATLGYGVYLLNIPAAFVVIGLIIFVFGIWRVFL